ncbi:phage antirepressor KilAC domain-containing protein [Thalassospira sp.]|uniref:phage antirepressor KilAC domain-containing protein n=1 Tax=Thalassospira sp. TaxID=1912094 RepID=UPI003AA91494
MPTPLQAFNDNTNATLLYSGTAIRIDDDKLNLTDMWRAAGADPSRRPYEWSRKEGGPFIEAVTLSLNTPVERIYIAGRGKGGSTLAHWQIGLAYAKYLSPEFHMWCNTVVRDRMQGTPTTAANDHHHLNDPNALRGLLLTYTGKVLELESRLEQAQPKLESFERIAQADGSMCITDAAKALQMRPKDLFDWMAQNGWTYKRPGTAHWLGYQSKTTSGLLEHKTTMVWRSDGSEKITEQVRITAKGLTRLATLIKPAFHTD